MSRATPLELRIARIEAIPYAIPYRNDNAAVNPLATELYNGRDDDCDGAQDEGFSAYYADGDGDLYGAGTATYATSQPTGFVTDGTDCDDNAAGTHPGATDIAGDGIDQDCSGVDTAAYESTVTYTGATQGKAVKGSKPVTFSAAVTSTESACVSSRSVTFTVNGVPKTVSSTTSGVAAAVYDVASWPSGPYPVTIALPASSSGACAADADGATGTWTKKGRK